MAWNSRRFPRCARLGMRRHVDCDVGPWRFAGKAHPMARRKKLKITTVTQGGVPEVITTLPLCHPDRSEAEWRDLVLTLECSFRLCGLVPLWLTKISPGRAWSKR